MDPIEQKFARIGARVNVGVMPRLASGRGENPPVRVDIRRDGDGEFFDVWRRSDVRLDVVDAVAHDRHLLLVVREPGVVVERHERFLCGFDERSWFAAAVPEDSGAVNVQDAKDALKPKDVWDSMREWDVPMELRDLRYTNGFLRQGEWFFLPRPWMEVYESFVLRNEPIQRGGGKPHICQRSIAGTASRCASATRIRTASRTMSTGRSTATSGSVTSGATCSVTPTSTSTATSSTRITTRSCCRTGTAWS
jgi:hypothetical protein